MKKSAFIVSLVFLISIFKFSNLNCRAQGVSISPSATLPNLSAGLDVNFTNKGLLIPRVNLTSTTDVITIPSPAVSLLVYNTNAAMTGGGLGFWYWNGTQWVQAIGPAGPVGCASANYIIKSNGSSATCTVAPVVEDATGKVGIGTTAPLVSVHINATDAIAIPAGTTAQQPATPPVGSLRFNITKAVVEVFNGTCWQNINTPPIGSTYIQWFGAADPNTLYPCTTWISSDIANGEFIRATGGLSNVAAPPLTGILQNFATEDHTHSSSGSVGNSSTLSTSTDGSHNHGGNTTGVSSFAGSWIPFDDNLTNNAGSGFSGSNGTTCGNPWNGVPVLGNFMGQMGDACFSHTHGINADGLHFHTIAPHSHSLSILVGNMNSGNIAAETRPANVAVVFWRRTL